LDPKPTKQETDKMAKTIDYLVSFSPAERSTCGRYWSVRMSLLTAGERHDVQASSLPELEGKVRALAAAFGQACSPYIRLKDQKARKPAGFDGWKRGLHIIA
jgi:hypothetical protein